MLNREEVSIVVVDDVNTMRIQIKELLKLFGFRKVFVASNGEEVKQMLETIPIHLLMVDWHMSPTAGIELLKYVRSHPEHKNIAFVMVTAESAKEQVIEAVQSGVDEYLLKPLTALQVQTKVYAALLKKQVFSG